MAQILKGTPSIVALPDVPAWSNSGGHTVTKRWKGRYADLRAYTAQLIQDGFDWRMQPADSGFWVLEATTQPAVPGGAPPANPDDELAVTWTRGAQEIFLDIFQHANFLALNATTEQSPLIDYRASGTVPTGLTGNAALFQALIKEKVFQYGIFRYELRRNAIAPRNWNGTQGVTNEGQYYGTKAALVAAEGVPDTIKFALPDGKYYKHASTITQMGNGKWRIETTFEHNDDIKTVLYTAVS